MAWNLSSSHRLQTAGMKPQGTQKRESEEAEFLDPMTCAGELKSGFQGFMNESICIYIQDCLQCVFLRHNSVVIHGRWVKRMEIFQAAELDCPQKHHLWVMESGPKHRSAQSQGLHLNGTMQLWCWTASLSHLGPDSNPTVIKSQTPSSMRSTVSQG